MNASSFEENSGLSLELLSDTEEERNILERYKTDEEPPETTDDVTTCQFPLWCAFWSVKAVWLLLSVVYLWMSWFFSFFGFIPANCFGFFSGEKDTMALTVSFAITFAFSQVLCTIVFLADFPKTRSFLSIRLPGSISLGGMIVGWTLICAVAIAWLVVLMSSLELQASVIMEGILCGIEESFFVLLCGAFLQPWVRAPYVWSLRDVAMGVGSCLGLWGVSPQGETCWTLLVDIPAVFLFFLSLQRLVGKGFVENPAERQNTYWFTMLQEILMSSSFWILAGYCVLCYGPFLSVAYSWCSLYVRDVYGLSDWRNNDLVCALWCGVILGAAAIAFVIFTFRPTKWLSFGVSVVAFISSLCIAVVPAAKMSTRVFSILLFVFGFSAGSCKSAVYPLFFKYFGVYNSVLAVSLTTSLTVLSAQFYHLISYWLLSAYSSQAKSSSSVWNYNVYQFSVWLLCVVSFLLAAVIIVCLKGDPSNRQKETSSCSSGSIELRVTTSPSP